MAPRPLFAANVSYGLRNGAKSGIKMAIGHSIVEFPLVVLLGIGVFSLETFPEFRIVISILGAITLFGFAILQIKTVLQKKENTISKIKHGPLVTGIVLCTKSIFHHMVVDYRFQINCRCHVNLGIFRHTSNVFTSHMDGFCMVRGSVIYCFKEFANSFK